MNKTTVKETLVPIISQDEYKIQEMLKDPNLIDLGKTKEGQHRWIHEGMVYVVEPELRRIAYVVKSIYDLP